MRVRADKKAKKEVLKEGKFMRLVKKGDWEFVERHNCSGIVIILAMTPKEEVIFVEQYRIPVGKNVIEFPAGLINDHGLKKKESIQTAAKRELLEEAGYRAKKVVKVLQGPVASGSSADLVSMVYASGLEKVNEGGGDSYEDITVHLVPLSKVDLWLKKMEQKGCLVEPKIYTGLYFLSTYNKIS